MLLSSQVFEILLNTEIEHGCLICSDAWIVHNLPRIDNLASVSTAEMKIS